MVVYRLWSGGTVDALRFNLPLIGCEPVEYVCPPLTIIPGACAADLDHNGGVEVPDLLALPGEWGPCQ